MHRILTKLGSVNKLKVVSFNNNNITSSRLFKQPQQQQIQTQSINSTQIQRVQQQFQQSSFQTRFFADAAPVKVAAESIKKLRERTSAGYLDCKKALEASNNDQEKAIEWLKAKGALKAAAKSGRVAPEGYLGFTSNESSSVGVVVEMNSETDFVCRGKTFTNLLKQITHTVATQHASSIVSGGDQNALDKINTQLQKSKVQSPFEEASGTSLSIEEAFTAVIARLGENVRLRRVITMSNPDGIVGSYVHNAFNDPSPTTGISLGKTVSLISLSSKTQDRQGLLELGNQLAAQIAGFKPLFVKTEEITDEFAKEFIEKNNTNATVDTKSARERPKWTKEKIINELVLMNQEYVFETSKTVKQFLEESEKKFGAQIEIKGFLRIECGEGIEKKESNFAEEVKQQMAGNA